MAEKPGLQIERTHLSWERTAIGFLTVAGILMFHTDSPLKRGRVALAIVSIALALLVFGVARARGRITVHRDRTGRPVVRAPAAAIALVGGCIATLSALIALAIALGRW